MGNTERIVIVGAAETDAVGLLPGHSTTALHLEAARNAICDAGIELSDIDGVAGVFAPGPVAIAHHLGIRPRWIDTTTLGGTSFLTHVRHAAAAIHAGHCSTVLVTHGESGRSRVAPVAAPVDRTSPMGQFELPYGVLGPITRLTLPLMRYLADTGTRREDVAMVPVVQREWAVHNPRARLREPITVEDVFASPVIAWPFHQLECCLVTDGGGALVITTENRARDMDGVPVAVLGTGEGYEGDSISLMHDMTTFRGFTDSSRDAFTEAGITTADVDHLMVYDAFAHLPLFALEDMGFVERGQAGTFIAEGNTRPGGSLPMNTNGGGLSYTHTGMYGMFAIQESVRQLRGRAPAQVEGVEISVVQGHGGTFSTGSCLVLGKV